MNGWGRQAREPEASGQRSATAEGKRRTRIRIADLFVGGLLFGTYGLFRSKRHLVNDQGDLLAFRLTPGHVDDRRPVPEMVRQVEDLFSKLFGKPFGDRGYLAR